jgi:hypothetical protein
LPEGEEEPALPKTLSGEESSLPEGDEAPAEPKTLSGEESGMPDDAGDEQSNA